MKKYKLNDPIYGNFKYVIIKLIMDKVMIEDVEVNSNKIAKKFFTDALEVSLEDENVEKFFKYHDHNFKIEDDATVSFMLPGTYGIYSTSYIELGTECTFFKNNKENSSISEGFIEFKIDPRTGAIVQFGYEEV